MEERTMALRINETIIAEAAIATEAARHASAPAPEAAARRALAVRELLLQRAGELGLLDGGRPRDRATVASPDDEEAAIAAVLDREVRTPTPTADECRRHFEANVARFTSGELVAVRHILFAVTPRTPVMALRGKAEAVHAELRAQPERFAARARELSNCPSAEQGGNLGQFGRGEMVPEFDRAVFDRPATGLLPELVTSRFGFHIVEIVRRIPGRPLPFEVVHASIAAHLSATVEEAALRQYVALLAGRARIEGVELAAAATPLVQ
jgi:peptidyl-prolyl cis-trans isomerase C